LTLVTRDRRIFNQLGCTDLVGDFTIDIAWEANETLLLNSLYLALSARVRSGPTQIAGVAAR
jgi:hypothetical protein